MCRKVTASLLLMMATLMVGLMAACGGGEVAAPTIIEKEVIREVEVPVIVEKEVIREVEVEKVVVKEVVAKPTATPKPAKVYKMRLSASMPANNPFTIREAEMVKQIMNRTNGAVDIELFPSGSLVKPLDAPKSVASGTIAMDASGMVFYGSISDIATILTPSMVGISTNDLLEVLATGTEGRKILDDEFARLGIKALGLWNQVDIGMGSFYPLNKVEHFKGKKLRAAGELTSRVLRALGAEVVVLGGEDAVEAMRRGIIDGGTNNAPTIISRGYKDFMKGDRGYYVPWTAAANVGMLVVNLKTWGGLPADLQKIVLEEAEAAATYMTGLEAELSGVAMWTLVTGDGLTFQGIDDKEKAKLQKISLPIFKEFVDKAKPQPQATRMFELMTGG